ncbi:MAG: hypothetical protein Q9M48_12115 [Rhodobacterales bacterium]|nr:hypothetical protein [Rhodobacterales bacterium]
MGRPKIEYSLTDLGKKAEIVIRSMAEIGQHLGAQSDTVNDG